jgi:hypothetical protein
MCLRTCGKCKIEKNETDFYKRLLETVSEFVNTVKSNKDVNMKYILVLCVK